MLVIQLGDLIHKPLTVRAQQAERIKGSAARAQAAELASSEERRMQGEERSKQMRWCEQAFWSLHEALACAMLLATLPLLSMCVNSFVNIQNPSMIPLQDLL